MTPCLRFMLAGMLLVALGGLLSAADKPVLIIVDRSMSMRDNDEHNYSSDCAHLAVATLREGKAIAMVGFAADARTILPWTVFEGHADRRAARDNVLGESLRYMGGSTNYVGALQQAYTELMRRQAPRGSRVLFFTDGAPNNDSKDIAAVARDFQSAGWVVDGLALTVGQEEMTDDMRRITEMTGGSYTEVTRAEDLVERFNALAASENDYFTLDVSNLAGNTVVQIPPGTHRLVWISVRDEQGNGAIRRLERDGQLAPLGENDHLYRYPADFERTGNLQILNISEPLPGTYTASYVGEPRSVYVNLSLSMLVEPLPIPDLVKEYDDIVVGVRVLLARDDGSIAEALRAQAAVRAVISDAASGQELARLDLPVDAQSQELRYATPWQVRWPEGVPKTDPRQYQVSYTIDLSQQWSLNKQDAFVVEPDDGPPPAALAPQSNSLTLSPSWEAVEGVATLPVAAQGITSPHAIAIPTVAGFTSTYEPEPPQLRIAHSAREPGRYEAVVGDGASHADESLRLPPISVRHDVYRYTGERTLQLTGPGQTPLASWINAAAESAAQPLQPAVLTLASADGAQLQLHWDRDGAARIEAAATVPAGTYSGEGTVVYGALPGKPLQVHLQYEPPSASFDWPEQLSLTGSAEARAWSEHALVVQQTAGLPGRALVRLSDFSSDNGDVLSADYDLRASAEPERIQPGEAITVHLRAYHGSDLLPGTYTGTITIEHQADNGMRSENQRQASIIVPAR